MLFHATICFTLALIIKFGIVPFYDDNKFDSIIIKFFVFTLCTTTWGLFMFGVTEFIYALKRLDEVLRKPISEPVINE